MSLQLADWLTISHWPKIAYPRLLRLISAFPSTKDFFDATPDEWLAAGATRTDAAIFKTRDHARIEANLAWAETTNHTILTLDDVRYPSLLKEMTDPPIVLYVRGSVACLNQPQVALVGSRQASPYGKENAFQFAEALAKQGYAITSGLARGIDAAAHQGAVKSLGVSIGVIGSGFHHFYPKAHLALAEQMIDAGGAVLSEFSIDTPPERHNFPRRNRIIAGLSLGVLVVEAALRSGSLITARLALEMGREVFAVPGPIHHPQAKGCHYLIREGAALVETVTDITGQLGGMLGAALSPLPVLKVAAPAVSSKNRAVLDQIEYVTTPVDVIILRTGLTASEVSSILLALVLEGCVRFVPGGVVRVAAFN